MYGLTLIQQFIPRVCSIVLQTLHLIKLSYKNEQFGCLPEKNANDFFKKYI